MARTDIELMEYSSDANAQAAYVTNAGDKAPHNMTTDSAPSPFVASASPEYASYLAWNAFSGTTSYALINATSGYWQIDLGSGNTYIISSYEIRVNTIPEPNRAPKDWTLQGSNNGSTWTTIDTVTNETSWGNGEKRRFVCDTITTAYRYFRLAVTANNGDASFTKLEELFLYSGLLCFSESTIKVEGSYALKCLADITGSLNKTLTHTVSPSVDLSNKDYIGIYMRSSRTGANIKLGFHDSGGTTTEVTPTIFTADTWELKILDISAVSNANKDVIDSIVITVTNADAENTFYIDCIYADTFVNNLKQYRRTRVPGAITG